MVKMVPLVNPQAIANVIGIKIASLPPIPYAVGKRPDIVVREVTTTALRRRPEALERTSANYICGFSCLS